MSRRASALEASVFVDAVSSRSTRIVAAFVHVATANGWIARVSRLAETARWIAWCALAVDAASVTFAG